jgi:uncharacterized protein (UPF0548 family)
MPNQLPLSRRAATAARWPVGVLLTSWRYMWRTVPVDRWEMTGSLQADSGPALPDGVTRERLQPAEDGAGPLVHRLYRVNIAAARTTPQQLIRQITQDLDSVAPFGLASFQPTERTGEDMSVGDEYVVRMPGPWDGPVRVVALTPLSFRLATLKGHLEAGQIEFRASRSGDSLEMVIESWARSGDRLSNFLYTHARMAKEIQFYMWTSVLQRIVELSGGRRDGAIVVTTRRVESNAFSGGSGPGHGRAERRLTELSAKALNYDPSEFDGVDTPGPGWHRDDLREALPGEAPGPPAAGGSWEIARELMVNYQIADPRRVRATYRPDAPLAGRDMLLTIGFAGLRLRVGVRVGDVYDETREVDGREARVFGWDYRTLEGHIEEGQMHYEVWKWLDRGAVEFRLHATSRAARSGPLLVRLGFRLFGRQRQLDFYRQTCRRIRRLTESQLEIERVGL